VFVFVSRITQLINVSTHQHLVIILSQSLMTILCNYQGGV